jgi:circadian clock protein KaiB
LSGNSSAPTISKNISENNPIKTGRRLYVLELFVSGMTWRSIKTVRNVKCVLEQELPGNYTLEVVDVFKNPEYTKKEQIMVTPTLIKKFPLPTKKIMGNIATRERIIDCLNLNHINPVNTFQVKNCV